MMGQYLQLKFLVKKKYSVLQKVNTLTLKLITILHKAPAFLLQ